MFAEGLALALKYWQWIAGVLLILALVAFYNFHVDGLIKTAVDKAVTENNQTWQKSEQAAIAKAQAEAQATQLAHQNDLAAIAALHAKALANAKALHDKDVAAARAGSLKLRLAVASCSSGTGVQAAPGPASSGNDAPTAELSSEVTGALISIADDADAVSSQLSACQQVIFSDRKAFSTTGVSP